MIFLKKNIFRRRRVFIVLILAVVLGLAGFRLIRLLEGSGAGPDGFTDRVVYVNLGQATFGPLREIGTYYGSLTSAGQFIVSPRVGGALRSLLVDIGDEVESGRTVALLDDESFILARQQAAHAVALNQAQLEEAEANLKLAQNDMERQQSLNEKNIVAQADFEQAENRLRQAQARLHVAQSQLNNARSLLQDADLLLSYTQIVVNWAEGGARFVGSRLVDEGDLLSANTPILTVVSLDPLILVVEVIEKDYNKISLGQTVELRTEAWPGEIFPGRVTRIAPVLSTETRQARVEIEVSNPGYRLKPGMFAEARFIFAERAGAWSVPQDIPFRTQNGFVLFLADEETKTVRQLPITLGLLDGGQVELVGADPIDQPVVFLGQHLLSDGQSYQVAGEKNRDRTTSP